MATTARHGELFPALAGSSAGRRRIPFLATVGISMLMDLMCVGAGVLAGRWLFQRLHPDAAWPGRPDLLLAIAIEYWLVFIFLARTHKLYDLNPSMLQVRTTENLLRISCFCLILVYAELYLSHTAAPRLPFCFGWSLSVLLMLITKHSMRGWLGRAHALGGPERRVLILGTGSEARRIFSYLRNSRHLGLLPIAFVNEGEPTPLGVIYSHDYTHRWHAPVHHLRLTAEFLAETGAAEVFLADPQIDRARTTELTAMLGERGITLSSLGSEAVPEQAQRPTLRSLDGVPVVCFTGDEPSRPVYECAKRALDLAAALALMLLALPIMILVAFLIRASSSGPVLFQQERVGRGGKPFTIYKFRSMHANAPRYGRSPEDGRDPRITPVGRILRKTSLDELPQLWNVFRGEMTLVGPRPEMPYVVAGYSAAERRRLSVPQGLTGLWQLSADRKYSIHQSLEYDAYYVENRGFFLDAAILLHTVLFAVKGI